MCGIAACIKKQGIIDRSRFDKMTDIIKHRGPDDRGVYYDGNLALGHRRLSIIDLSKDGHQPFEMIEGYVLIFNGEIYNYIELREELLTKGHKIRTKSDTEIIIHAYCEWGKDCVKHFNGMWAFALYDKAKRTLFCSRDRFGVKPFYYTNQEGQFLVASEIKQFFEMLDNRPRANKDLLMQYIVRGTIERPPFTLFEDVFQLEPGQILTYDLDTNQYMLETYYDISDNAEDNISYQEACEEFRKTFTEAVRLRLRSDVPLGYFLSGGLDSSAIVCVADKLIRESDCQNEYKEQHAVSSCFEEKEYDEQEYMDEVLNVTDIIPHKVFPEEKTMIDELDKLIWHMDEPISGTTGFAQWSVCKAAKENGLTVMLDGQGSDEQLAGYTDFYPVLFLYALQKGKFQYFKKEVDAYLRLRATSEKRSFHVRAVLSAMKDYLTPASMEKTIKLLYLEKIAKVPFDKAVLKTVLKSEFIYPKRNPRGFIKAYMENELLYQMHQGDRYSMAFSIENRNPFLDYRLVNRIFRMPFEYKIRDGYTKAVLRDSMEDLLPKKVQKRISKFGFETPGNKWFEENKGFYYNELVNGLKKYDKLFDREKVLKWCTDESTDKGMRNALMWRIIDSSRWIDIFDVVL